MNEQFEHTFKKMRSDSLSHEERAEMRARLRLFMAEHPVELSAFERFAITFTYGRASVWYARPALAGFLIIFLVGGGTSYAAADALPGDILYTIKTRVNEPITSALALSPEAKASVSATLAVRRLEEAEVLASEGRLSSAVSVEIESKFEEHIEAFEAKTTVLTEKDEDIKTVADVQSDLEASLKVHASVLADLSAALPEAEAELSPIQRKVALRVQKVEGARMAVEKVIAKKIDGDTEKAASEKKRIVELEVSERRTSGPVAAKAAPQAETMTMMMAVSVAEDAAGALTADPAVEAFDEGSAAFEVGQYGEAFTKFQGVIRALKQEKLEQDVRSRLKFGNFGKDDSKQTQDDKNDDKNAEDRNTGNEGGKAADRQDEDDNNEGSRDEDPSSEDASRENASSTGNILPEQLLNVIPVRLGQ
ncbi:hypothetical protein C4556_03635 [Candidatus Parcubacteria bacterium]|nr:MAG: hypothetical protein C4556_03635 [Candidatus Parcubacteria bacterium]